MPCSNSIRLLRIYKGSPTDPVEFSLEIACLDESVPEYEALSYVWGSNFQASYIIHRDRQEAISVTTNLHDALKGVRWCHQDRLIWVDALCINQKDKIEKGVQVRKMNSIYICAARVLVWLGKDDNGVADEAFGILCALANEGLRVHLGGEASHIELARYKRRFEQDKIVEFDTVPHIMEQNRWRKVMLFFCQPWYTRLWVLQEIVLAQEAVVLWGSCSILWEHVGAAMETIRKNHTLWMILETRNLQNAFFMWHLSNSRRSRNSESSCSQHLTTFNVEFLFLHLLDLARSFEVTDPRDKIYGLLGFPTKDGSFGPCSIISDYTLSASEVYTQVTRTFIEKDQNLNVLGLVLYNPPDSLQEENCISNLPSWAPNFNSKATAFPISNINTTDQFSAGLSRPICLLESPHPTNLHLTGVELDIIRVTRPSMPFVQTHNIVPYLNDLLEWCISAGVSLRTLATTLTAGRDKEGHLLSSLQKQEHQSSVADLMNDLGIEDPSFPPVHTDISHINVIAAREALWRFVTYRQPFITEQGVFGLGPRGVEKGDKVVVLWGGQCPFVIGKIENEDGWVLKGECFVEEWMDGKSIDELIHKEEMEDTVFRFL